MSDAIRCISCDAVSFNDFGKTKLYCSTCFEALRQRAERAENALRWRKYPDEKPEDGQQVMVRLKTYEYQLEEFAIARYTPKPYPYNRDEFDVTDGVTADSGLGLSGCPTHWMPIPEIKEGE